MPINKFGGNKNRRSKNHRTETSRKASDIAKQTDDEAYGKVIKELGNKGFSVEYQTTDGMITAMCRLSGGVRKKVHVGDYVLVQTGVYSLTNKNACIVDAYSTSDVQNLRSNNLWDYIDNEEKNKKTFEFTTEPIEDISFPVIVTAETDVVPVPIEVAEGIAEDIDDDNDIDIDAI